jgi:hypothetical protein
MSIFHVAIGLTGLMILPILPDLAANLLISLAPGAIMLHPFTSLHVVILPPDSTLSSTVLAMASQCRSAPVTILNPLVHTTDVHCTPTFFQALV